MALTYEDVWDNCLDIVKDNIPLQSFKTWFEPIKPVKLENDILTILVPSQFFYEWLEEHYVSLLKKIIKRELGTEGRLEYRIVVENSSQNNNPYTINVPTYQNEKSKNPSVAIPLNISSSIKNPFVIPGLKQVNIDPQLNPNYTFDSFVEGECNQLARSAGFAVATKPGTNSFNPLVIYGGTGLGKTHLAQAIGNQIKQIHNNKTVLYVQSEKFTNQFIEAVKNNSTNDFIVLPND
jgi:chromosomal replication initiator protein